jgi:hypothetical protein
MGVKKTTRKKAHSSEKNTINKANRRKGNRFRYQIPK